MKKKWFLLCLVCSALILAGGIQASFAQDKYPSKPVEIIVSWAAGGATDVLFRALGAVFPKHANNQQMIVKNIPGGGAAIGYTEAMKAKGDGYTLVAVATPMITKIHMSVVKFSATTFAPVILIADNACFLLVHKDSPYKNLKDLHQASKKKSLNCSVSGMGSRSHLNAMILKDKVGVNLEVVPFKGSAPAMMALLGGNVDLSTLDDLTILLQKEKVRSLAIFAEKRSAKFADAPTLKELGYDIPLPDAAIGICGPPGLSPEARKVLSESLARAIKTPEFMSRIDKLGPTPIYLPGTEFQALAEASYRFVEEYKDLLQESK